MIVSNFEILVKRIANVPGPDFITAPFRRIVNGYFLNVTNLDPNRIINLAMRITVPIASASSGGTLVPGRDLNPSGTAQNVISVFDLAFTNDVTKTLTNVTPSVNPNTRVFITNSFALGPKQTGSITLLPNIGGNSSLILDSNLEIRGFIELVQIPVGFSQLFITGVSAVDILCTPEIRGTVLDNAYPNPNPADEMDFDQVSYALPTASGKIQNTVEAVPPIVLTPIPFPRPLPPIPPIPFSDDIFTIAKNSLSKEELKIMDKMMKEGQ